MKITQRIQKLEAKRAVQTTDQTIFFRFRRVGPGMLDQPPGELRRIHAQGITWLRANDESEEQFKCRVLAEAAKTSGGVLVCCIGFDHHGDAPANAPENARG
jgi:hypothetical protein